MTFLLVILMVAADLSSIKTEPDLDRRSEMALLNADHDVDLARVAYKAGDIEKFQRILEDLRSSVELSQQALEATHKQARKDKFYKRAELKTRALVRRLMALSEEVGIDERKPVEDARLQVQEVHDHLLGDIMSKKK